MRSRRHVRQRRADRHVQGNGRPGQSAFRRDHQHVLADVAHPHRVNRQLRFATVPRIALLSNKQAKLRIQVTIQSTRIYVGN